ncbi:MAG: hypothetical protein ACREP0_03005 [Rhodanobacteraceae bacterium]
MGIARAANATPVGPERMKQFVSQVELFFQGDTKQLAFVARFCMSDRPITFRVT